ncbi:hypothetical protein PSACC_00954 [Paramicrosporidium saccamoebae]|uniref:Uncharacterized protein n=1 Tax=Paramicrosporidium saccamoebae TaxID=1246581 RepID=A0A2H9TNB7_9FUNG|nr:hypothetical protein PSACC_00954 [Paramicrosporidium saccamoebae]
MYRLSKFATVPLLLAFSTPAARFNSQAVEGGRTRKEKVRSVWTVISQRRGVPGWAGPTGGEGVAPPAGIVSFSSEGRFDTGAVPFLLDIADHESPGELVEWSGVERRIE